MPTFRERLTGLFRRTLDRTVGRLRPVRPAQPVRPTPPPAPPSPSSEPPRPAPAVPAAGLVPPPTSPPSGPRGPSAPAGPVGSDAAQLLHQLSNLAIATADITKRLNDLGYGQSAQAIVGVPPIPETLEVPPPEASEPVPSPQAPLPPPPPPEPPPPPSPPHVPPSEPPASPTERYLLAGSSIFIPFLDPETAFHTLAAEWSRAMIGSPRPGGVPVGVRPMYAPDAFVRGSALDPGVQIPAKATRSAEAFVEWAKENGYEKGLSIEVDGLLAPPGRASIVNEVQPDGSTRARMKDVRAGRPVWVAGAHVSDPSDEESET